MLKFGIVGAGMIAQYGFDGITASGAAEVIAIADPHQGRAQEFARRNRVREVLSDAKDVFRNSSIDAVYIATPTVHHAQYAIAAFEAGKHVLLEKPFAFSFADARKVVDAGAKSGKTFMLGMNYRFEKGAQQVRALSERGYFGEIHRIRAIWRRRSGAPRLGTWFGNKKMAGGGCLMDIGVHVIDLALWTSLSFDAASVSAAVYSKFGSRGLGEGGWGASTPEGLAFDVDDSASAFIRMKSGATIQVEVSWVAHQKEDDAHEIELFGTEAGARVASAEVYRTDPDLSAPVDVTDLGVPLAYPHCNKFVNFVRSILGQEKMCVLPDQVLAVQRIIDAAYQSSASGREVLL
ncbi:MAG TPA: Gfo/Idh/MocA family oxidoreductase [Spirochaetia bacterium]|nr:Gfo/Idh/MocA family oxidoreductase [Spirochaetia bacterium]